jgi:hypothetical protein
VPADGREDLEKSASAPRQSDSKVITTGSSCHTYPKPSVALKTSSVESTLPLGTWTIRPVDWSASTQLPISSRVVRNIRMSITSPRTPSISMRSSTRKGRRIRM